MIRRLRRLFQVRDYIEVETPVLVSSPGIDPYIDAFPGGDGLFLAPSPELEMKKLLAEGVERIFQFARAFRSEERGALHSPEFTLLEWYTAGEDYRACMALTEEAVRAASDSLAGEGLVTPSDRWEHPFPRITVDEIFRRCAGWAPSRNFQAEPFFRDLIEKVEPALKDMGAVFLCDYPEPVGALARRRPDDPLVCERFELYLGGVEICNGFSELTDSGEQRQRFERHNAQRQQMGKSTYPVDEQFLAALERGIPACAGNALGVDRLLMVLAGGERLSDVTLLGTDSGVR